MSDKSAQASSYAQAILSAMVEQWQGALDDASAAIAADSKLAALLGDSSKSVDAREQALAKAMPAGTPDEIHNLLKLLIQNGDLEMLSQIGASLAQTASGQSAPVKAEITSAVELSAADQEQLRDSLTAQYGPGLVFSFQVDPSLMGGLRVRVGDHLTDTSVASRLSKLRESVISVVR